MRYSRLSILPLLILSLASASLVVAQPPGKPPALPTITPEMKQHADALLSKSHAFTPAPLSVPSDAASIAEGKRLAIIQGCLTCHGEDSSGNAILDNPALGRLIAPNLTAVLRTTSNAEVAGIIRGGVYPTGRGLVLMPSWAMYYLSDEDLGDILAYLKSLPAKEGLQADKYQPGPVATMILNSPQPGMLAVTELVEQAGSGTLDPPPATGARSEHGRYLARTVCAHCHNPDLKGMPLTTPPRPPLVVTAAYSLPEFSTLLRTGVARGGRESGMITASTENLYALTDAEIADLYQYLHDDLLP